MSDKQPEVPTTLRDVALGDAARALMITPAVLNDAVQFMTGRNTGLYRALDDAVADEFQRKVLTAPKTARVTVWTDLQEVQQTRVRACFSEYEIEFSRDGIVSSTNSLFETCWTLMREVARDFIPAKNSLVLDFSAAPIDIFLSVRSNYHQCIPTSDAATHSFYKLDEDLLRAFYRKIPPSHRSKFLLRDYFLPENEKKFPHLMCHSPGTCSVTASYAFFDHIRFPLPVEQVASIAIKKKNSDCLWTIPIFAADAGGRLWKILIFRRSFSSGRWFDAYNCW